MFTLEIRKIARTDGQISHVGGQGWWQTAWVVKHHLKFFSAQVQYLSGSGGPMVEAIDRPDGSYYLRSKPDGSGRNNLEHLPEEPPPWRITWPIGL